MSASHAARRISQRAASSSVSESAIIHWMAWFVPIGRPNVSRVFAYSMAMLKARSAMPTRVQRRQAATVAIASAARERGVQIRTGARVERILVELTVLAVFALVLGVVAARRLQRVLTR